MLCTLDKRTAKSTRTICYVFPCIKQILFSVCEEALPLCVAIRHSRISKTGKVLYFSFQWNILTVMKTAVIVGLLFATTLFHVSSSCSVTYPCSCSNSHGDSGVLRCELNLSSNLSQNEKLVSGGRRENSLDISIIHNNAFKSLRCKYCLHIIYLDYNNVSVVEPDAFSDLEKLEILYMDNNKIQELHQNMFEHNPIMKKLDVSVNRLRFLHPDMFRHMTLFYFLNVSHNMLVLNGAILNSDTLNILDAGYSNQMKHSSWHTLEGTIFSGLPNLKKLVLDGNSIRCLSLDTFTHNPHVVEVNLKNNELKVLSHEMFRHFHEIDSLIISNNPLVCDCRMKMFAAWCSNHSVKLDAVSCGTPLGAWSLLQSLSCDTLVLAHTFMPVTDSVCTMPSVSVKELTTSTISAVSVTSSMPASEENIAPSTSSVSISRETTSAVYRDQQETISGNSSWDKLSSFVQSSINSTTQMPYHHSGDSNNLTSVEHASPGFSWIVVGTVCGLITSIVFLFIAIVLRRRRGSEYSVPATHCSNFTLCDCNTRTYDKVREDRCRHTPYITTENLHQVTALKTELHYLCHDVTGLTDAAPEVSPWRLTSNTTCRCSGLLGTNVDTISTTAALEEHIYEMVE
jgi:Leucine-rich repeat (LRR) protein